MICIYVADRPEGVDGRPGGTSGCATRARWSTRSSSPRPRRRRRRSSRWRRTPAARWASTSSTTGKHALVHLRRPLEAGRRLPPAVAAAAPPAGPRGVPGRRLLPPLAAARARLQAHRRARRRLAHRAADHRDAGRRRLRLHPDERDLDHRRADLPPVRPLLLGRPARRSTSASRSRASAGTRRRRR